MRAILRWVTLAGTASLLGGLLAGGPPLSAANAAAASRVTVHIKGINRDGKVVAAQGATLIATNSFPILVNNTARVTRQTYLVGAQIPTFAGKLVTSETLVVQFVRIRARGTIVLNARHGKKLRVALRGAAGAEQNLTAAACLYSSPGGDAGPIAAGGGPGTPVYVVPRKSTRIGFSYLADLQSHAAVNYLLYGTANGRIPARPDYQQSVRRLARVNVTLKGGADPTATGVLNVQPAADSQCGYATSFGGSTFGPYSAVDYRTAGEWTTSIQTQANPPARQGSNFDETHQYRAGRHYSETFGSAAVGPSGDFPEIEGNIFDFSPVDMFNDPNPQLSGGADASTNVITLRLHGHLVRKQTWYNNCQTCFQLSLHKAGWYHLSVNSRRWQSNRLLSPKVAVTWRFHVNPSAPAGQWVSFPVTETVYQPRGLNLTNQAPADGRTVLRITVDRAGGQFSPAPRYRLRTVRVQMSVNDGATWRALKLTRRGSYWLATVPDPASGYVSLRSVVTDVHGDSSVQTIDRAFAIAG
jgi:hypothetical protein